MKDEGKNIQAVVSFLARVAAAQSVSLADLSEMLRKEYEEVERAGKPKDVSSGERIETATPGCFVTYVDTKKGNCMAHVLEVKSAGLLKIRVHLTAQPNFDKDDVPYSAKPKKEHWSYR